MGSALQSFDKLGGMGTIVYVFNRPSHLTDSDIAGYINLKLCQVKCIHMGSLSGMCETKSICAMAPVSNFLPYGIRVQFLSLEF